MRIQARCSEKRAIDGSRQPSTRALDKVKPQRQQGKKKTVTRIIAAVATTPDCKWKLQKCLVAYVSRNSRNVIKELISLLPLPLPLLAG